jgi:conjugal transfer/entry exclusion protein
MQSSDRLNFKKNNIEVIGKMDSLNKQVKSLKSEVEQLKDSFKTHITLHAKSIKELYAFCNKLEEIYFNGLNSNLNSDSNSNFNYVNTEIIEEKDEEHASQKYTISSNTANNVKPIFSSESTQYNNLFNC